MAQGQGQGQDPDFTLKCNIINEVQQRPILYNKGHPMYFVRNAKNDEFQSIGVASRVSTKWNGIH